MLARERLVKLLDAMADAGVDALLVYGNAWQNDYLRYVSDFGILEGQGMAIVRNDGHVTLCLDSPLEADRAAVDCRDAEVKYAPNVVREAEIELNRLGNQRIGIAPYRLIPRGIMACKYLNTCDQTELMDRLLMGKIESEIAALRRAAWLADVGYGVFRDAARPGRADYELIAEVEAFYRSKGVDDNFQIIGVGGPEVRGMAPPSGKRLKEGDLVTTELTPCVDGYYTQICRTLVVGLPNPHQLMAFSIYREAMEAGLAVVRDGITAADIAFAENEVFRRYGLGKYVTDEYTRVRGHGIGLFADTKPHILEDVTTRIDEGMTLIVHPNTYHPMVGYMVLGDSIVVTQDGYETLTRSARELFSVPVSGS